VSKKPPSERLKPKQPLQSPGHKGLSAALKARTKELGLTVRELAKRWGRSVTTTHKSLDNERRIDFMEFLDLCAALEIADPIAFAEPFVEPHRKYAKPRRKTKS
jgi:hypothetical protein